MSLFSAQKTKSDSININTISTNVTSPMNSYGKVDPGEEEGEGNVSSSVDEGNNESETLSSLPSPSNLTVVENDEEDTEASQSMIETHEEGVELSSNIVSSAQEETSVDEFREPSLERAPSATPEDQVRDDLVYLYGSDKILAPTGDLVDVSVLQNKFVAIFASALHAQEEFGKDNVELNKVLADFAIENMDKFAVLYLSQDHAKEDFDQFLLSKPFYAIPYEKSATRATMTEEIELSPSSIPSIVIMSPKGDIVTTWGKSAILWNGNSCIEEWELDRPGVSYLGLFASKYLNLSQ